jgi:hypothetical protein
MISMRSPLFHSKAVDTTARHARAFSLPTVAEKRDSLHCGWRQRRGDRDTAKVLTVLSTAKSERMKFKYQRGLDRIREGFLTLQRSITATEVLIKFVLPAAIIVLGIYFAIRFFQ